MSDSYTKAAMSVTPPVQLKNVYVLDVTGSSQNIRVPDAWIGKYITIASRGATVYHAFKFGSSGPTINEAAVSTIASDTVPVTTDGSAHVGSGGSVNYDLRNIGAGSRDPDLANSTKAAALQLRFGWKGSTTGQLVVTVSDGPVNP
jgi:hypothetical protein